MPPVFRFAPSPNGYLHLGHALSALLNFDLAQQCGGRLLLRIEDIDRVRSKPEYEAAIYEDLAWLGIAWETPVRRQSEHLAEYGAAIARLAAEGVVYRSFESRAEIARMVALNDARGPWPRDPDGVPLFPGGPVAAGEQARSIDSGGPYAWRLDMDKARLRTRALNWVERGDAPGFPTGIVAANPEVWGDAILARKETPTSYHLSVVIDDALQGVTEVVRGADLYHATGLHRLLQTMLDLPQPCYRHHALVFDEQGTKLSKSTLAISLRALRAQGVTPAGSSPPGRVALTVLCIIVVRPRARVTPQP